MSKPILDDSLPRDIRELQNRIAELERRQTPSGIIATQRDWGLTEVYTTNISVTNYPIYKNQSTGNPLTISFTPQVNCYWQVTMNIGIVQKMDAAYHYAYGRLDVNPVDVDGVASTAHIVTQHNDVNQFDSRKCQDIYKLAAGITYTATGMLSTNGGVWTYHQGKTHMQMTGVAWTRL